MARQSFGERKTNIANLHDYSIYENGQSISLINHNTRLQQIRYTCHNTVSGKIGKNKDGKVNIPTNQELGIHP